jgi:PhnB protein
MKSNLSCHGLWSLATSLLLVVSTPILAQPTVGSGTSKAAATHGGNDLQVRAELQNLVDVRDIGELINKLGHELDLKNWQEFSNIFTTDAQGEFPHGTYKTLAEIIDAGVTQGGAWDRTEHMITNTSIKLDGEKATATANFAAFNSPSSQKDKLDAHFDVGGRYTFGVVRTPNGWRISHLKLVYLWTNSLTVAATETTKSGQVNPIPDEYRGAIPYLNVKDAWHALDFYKRAFGAREVVSFSRQGGKLAHAEIRIGEAVVMLRDEYPKYHFLSPQTIGGTPVNILIYVIDVAAFAKQAVAAGATIVRPLEKQFHGDLMVVLKDPYGHSWFFASRIENMTPDNLKQRAADTKL